MGLIHMYSMGGILIIAVGVQKAVWTVSADNPNP